MRWKRLVCPATGQVDQVGPTQRLCRATFLDSGAAPRWTAPAKNCERCKRQKPLTMRHVSCHSCHAFSNRGPWHFMNRTWQMSALANWTSLETSSHLLLHSRSTRMPWLAFPNPWARPKDNNVRTCRPLKSTRNMSVMAHIQPCSDFSKCITQHIAYHMAHWHNAYLWLQLSE
jgi:hypothetical protein